ncbi:hypothetical protein DENSPDRAFT_885045 [Dentipellis sp. KUC8613]|nr:hypothetical protein DENSPDRAFT_885045 [Dentipellis sp. KUC8613]
MSRACCPRAIAIPLDSVTAAPHHRCLAPARPRRPPAPQGRPLKPSDCRLAPQPPSLAPVASSRCRCMARNSFPSLVVVVCPRHHCSSSLPINTPPRGFNTAPPPLCTTFAISRAVPSRAPAVCLSRPPGPLRPLPPSAPPAAPSRHPSRHLRAPTALFCAPASPPLRTATTRAHGVVTCPSGVISWL